MASFTGSGGFAPGYTARPSLQGIIALPGQVLRFGSLDFVADKLGHLRLCASLPSQAAESALSSSPELPLGSKAVVVTFAGEIVPQPNPLLTHGFPSIEQGSRLVGAIESILPLLHEDTEDDDESSGSFYPLREAFMADPVAGTAALGLETPIADQSLEELQATRLWLLAEQDRLAEQQAELERQREEQLRVGALQGRGRQVNRALCMREKDGIPLFPTPSHNLVAATMAARAIDIPEGTPGHDELRRLRILVEEAAL